MNRMDLEKRDAQFYLINKTAKLMIALLHVVHTDAWINTCLICVPRFSCVWLEENVGE